MIKFEFILDEADAENLFGCIQLQICNNLMKIQDALLAGNHDLIEYYKRDNEYFKELKLKLTNTKV